MSSEIEQIKERLDIVDVISSYVKLEKAGINYRAKCPFHGEKTASFFVSPSRQSFYCFGCGEKGDVITFVQKFESIDFKEALENLAKRAGVELKKWSGKNTKQTDSGEKDRLFEIMEKATLFYETNLKENKSALGYLQNRGMFPSSIKKWRLGFAPEGWRNLHDYLIQKGFSREDMLSVGLIKKVPNEVKFYDTFRNRVMFPISDTSGRVIAFSGRDFGGNDKAPKYLNSPETELFHKSEVLYGFHIAKNHLRKKDYAVLVEGQMDLVMSHQAGVPNAVASSGTALTENHLKKIKKISNKILIAYDSDPAGEKAAERAAVLALNMGMEVKVATLPEGEDPASTVKTDPKLWITTLKESKHFLDFALEKTIKENGDKNLAKEIFKKILPLLNLLGSEMEKSQFIKKIALKCKISEDSVWRDLKSIEKLKDSNRTAVKAETGRMEGEINNEEEDKEKLLFEAERYGFKLDKDEIEKETLKRNELERLRRDLQSATFSLDEKSITKEKEEKIKKEIGVIQKRIKELDN